MKDGTVGDDLAGHIKSQPLRAAVKYANEQARED